MLKNIVLIGMMGCGKSTIGKILENKMQNFLLVDTDELIKKVEEKTIEKIFETEGEKYFRALERELIKGLCQEKNLIIATGGGVFLNEENIFDLRQVSNIFYLKSEVNHLYERVLADNNNIRPLLKTKNPRETFLDIFNKRQLLYENNCDYIIEIMTKTPDEITDEIITKLD